MPGVESTTITFHRRDRWTITRGALENASFYDTVALVAAAAGRGAILIKQDLVALSVTHRSLTGY